MNLKIVFPDGGTYGTDHTQPKTRADPNKTPGLLLGSLLGVYFGSTF